MKWITKLKSFLNPLTETVKKVTRKKGLLHYYNRKKGYGFISSSQTEKDVFVHYSDMNDKLRKGDMVVFNVTSTEKGLKAENVELVEM